MDKHSNLFVAYKKAEDLIHSLGIETDQGIDTAAVNELRYAGRHVLNGLVAENEGKRGREFRRAEDHCERALYEAHDAAVFFYFRSFQQFKEDYSIIPIAETIPDFIEISASMNEARKFLAKAREDAENRASYYEQAEDQHATVKQAWARLDAAREELNKAVRALVESREEEAKAKAATASADAQREGLQKISIRVSIVVAIVTVLVNALIRVFF